MKRREMQGGWISAKVCALLVGIAICGGAIGSKQQVDDQDESPDIVVHVDEEGNSDNEDRPASDRWIGVVCEPIEDALRSQLDVPENEGLIVTSVVPGAPAEKAGLREHDVLLQIDDEPLREVADLVAKIRGADKRGLSVTYLRKGKRITQTVTPEPRPDQATWMGGEGPAEGVTNIDPQKLHTWLEELKNQGAKGALNFRVFGPGLEFHGVQGKKIDLPNQLSVEINKEGDEPARIKVRRGDETWEITEDHIDDLPEDVRPFVSGMMGQGGAGNALMYRLPGLQELPPMDSETWSNMDDRLDDMRLQLEEVLKQLEEMKGIRGMAPLPHEPASDQDDEEENGNDGGGGLDAQFFGSSIALYRV